MRRNYPLVYYIDFLVSAKDALRELSLDALAVINSQLIPLDDQNEAALPNDFVDYVRVGVKVGQYIKPLLERDSINRLQNFDSSWTPAMYNDTVDNSTTTIPAINVVGGDTVHWDSSGEFTGRFYGFSGAGSEWDTFKVIAERDVIKINEAIDLDHIVLEYISDGSSADAATKIEAYAVATIEAYVIYQMKEQNRNYNLQERQLAKQEYQLQYAKLIARKSKLTIESLRRILNRHYRGAPNT